MSKGGRSLIVLAVLFLCAFFLLPAVAWGTTDVKIELDGKPVFSDVPPYIDGNSRTVVPVRFVSEELGFEVDWDGVNRRVNISNDSSAVELAIGDNTARVDGNRVEMDAPAVINNGRTMVPLRFVAEAFGVKVEWVGATRTVVLNSRVASPDEPKSEIAARVNGSLVNVRTGPGTDYPRLVQLTAGTELFLTGKTGEWYQVSLPGEKEGVGWIAGWLVEKMPADDGEENNEQEEKERVEKEQPSSPEPPPAPPPAPDPEPPPPPSMPSRDLSLESASKTALVGKPTVNVRSSPGGSAPVIGTVKYGAWLDILAERDGWYQVRLEDGRTGWVAGWLMATRYSSNNPDDLPQNSKPGSILGRWRGRATTSHEKLPVITDIQVIEMEQGIKLQVTANSSLDVPNILRLNSPSRVVFDFNGLLAGEDYLDPIEVNCSPVDRIRGSQFEEETVRLVADLKENMVHSVTHQSDGKSIEILIQPVFPLAKTVVIDPGHGTLRSGGSSDPGAIGPSGLTEREVVTAISGKLGEILLNKGYDVVFVREEVTGFTLEERSHAANLCGGVFVSIHANAHPSRDVMGTETFYPGTGGGASADLIATSRSLAGYIQDELVNLLQRPNRGVKQANFSVLRHSHIPAVLVEVAFISNPQEEKLLAQEDFRNRAALAIARGIEKYY